MRFEERRHTLWEVSPRFGNLNANLIILGWMEKKKDVQWCEEKAWGVEAITRGKCRVSWKEGYENGLQVV